MKTDIQSGEINQFAWGMDAGSLVLRVAGGLMIFIIHGLHKLEGGLNYLWHGTAWPLLADVTGMHFPAPVAGAWLATVIQFICPLGLVLGWHTRVNALLLVGALGGAILQNLLAGRDPQLALLYTLVVICLVIMGGGRYSVDGRRTRSAD